MIKYSEGELLNTLSYPMSDDNDVKAISYALKWGIAKFIEYAVRTRLYADINTQPESILDYMAIELDAQYYREDMTVEQKREAIQNTIAWYMKAGTKKAVEDLVQFAFGEGTVIPWDEMGEEGAEPGCFDIITNAESTPEAFADLAKLIDKVKPASAHLRSLVIKREEESLWKHLFGSSWHEQQTLTNDIYVDDEWQAYPAGGFFAMADVTELLEDIALFRRELIRETASELPVGVAVTSDSLSVLVETIGESEWPKGIYTGSGLVQESITVLK